jgi:hypothetical protein
MERPSRFESTRRKLRLARYGVVAVSAAAFGAFALVARAGHAGKTTPAAASANATSQDSFSSDDSQSQSQSQSYDYGSSSIAPSYDNSTPLVQSSGS